MLLALIPEVNLSKTFWNLLISKCAIEAAKINTVFQSWIKTYDYETVVAYKYALVRTVMLF